VETAEAPPTPVAEKAAEDPPGALLDMFARIEAEAENGDASSDPTAERKRA
jgi:hypothetical protein